MGKPEESKTNNKGQFSIIAALLVAIILISTVIITYSTIRNSTITDQPQMLSAIDETNMAIKQILGFTVGYYGSVLQVTGNTSYARNLARSYMGSGLENVANMHPDWGGTFRASDPSLVTYWFKNASYSSGRLTVNYSLTRLGIYNITYTSSCKLTVQIIKSTQANKACLRVIKDDDEPLINLGQSNFRFYSYQYANSTWKLVMPTTEPVSFANGTYLIDIPAGVDQDGYLVQTEDPRGIVVVGSSFTQYVCSLSWNVKTVKIKYAVSGSVALPQILGAPDGVYATIGKGGTCEVTKYQGGIGTIKQIYFNITYYGSVSGTLEWRYILDGGATNKIEDLPKGGTALSPLKRTYNATSLRSSWTWTNLNSTSIQFANNDNQNSAYVDSIYVTLIVETPELHATIRDSLVVELLQNGTMRWLGQNIQMVTQAKPVPPLPVKAIRINQTTNGVNREVPFQVEDWNRNYQVPVGLTNNMTVLSGRQMIVFMANPSVAKITLWWDGKDTAAQTPYGYANRYFTNDDPANGRLTNGNLTLVFKNSSPGFLTSTVGTTSAVADFMRINRDMPDYGSNLAYVIHHGVIRDIVHQEAEWGSGGIANCPDVYSQIIITLPANATYYTYQLHLAFVSTQQDRTITDLCPIMLKLTNGQPQTENGTANLYPIVKNGTGRFYNYSSSTWQHHWSQIVSGAKGAGIMFTDNANQKLYIFDSIAASKIGALKANSTARTIELLPVSTSQVKFQYAFDIAWEGAVATFDNSTPIYKESGGNTTGLWIFVEYPPKVTTTTVN